MKKHLEKDYLYLSKVFQYIEALQLKGHQIGRKVGDMLELLTLGLIYQDAELKRRLKIEPKMEGYTGAGHKVEFGFYELTKGKPDMSKPFGMIENKKVGVEVTTHAMTRKGSKKLKIGDFFNIPISRKWFHTNLNCKIIFKEGAKLQIEEINTKKSFLFSIKTGDKIKIFLTIENDFFVYGPSQDLYECEDAIRTCIILEIRSFKKNEAKIKVFSCLTGPQTIEKAKQAALVSMDLRKKVDGKWGKEDLKDSEKKFTSVLILTETSHWEPKSRSVITTCIDKNLIVPDEIIVDLFIQFQKKFPSDYLDKISKSTYTKNRDVRKIIEKVINDNKGRILYDLEEKQYVFMKYLNGKLEIIDV